MNENKFDTGYDQWHSIPEGNGLLLMAIADLRKIQVKFDTGEIRDYNKVWPFAVATHFMYKQKK